MYIKLRSVLLFFALFILTACNSTPQYMYRGIQNWPKKSENFRECTDISGKYFEGAPNHSGAAPPGVWAFHFPFKDVRINDNSVLSREIAINFDHNQTMKINYEIDGKVVSSKQFDKSHYICTNEGLEIVLNKHSGQLDRIIPNPGFNTLKATIYRSGDYLYVHNRLDTVSLIFYIIPNVSYTEFWGNFLINKDEEY